MLREDLPVYNYPIMTLKKHFIRKKSRQTKSVRTAAGGFSVGGQSFMKSWIELISRAAVKGGATEQSLDRFD